MTQIIGTYYNGYVEFEKEILTDHPVKVLMTFLDDDIKTSTKKVLKTTDFGFKKAQELLKNFKGSFSDEVIDERRNDL